MALQIHRAAFEGREQALAEASRLNLITRDGQMAAGDLEDVHWHEYGVRIFVLEGSFETRQGLAGDLQWAGPGDLIVIPARTLHAARCPEPARYIAAFESEEALARFRPMPVTALQD